jgi:hypothetical protein
VHEHDAWARSDAFDVHERNDTKWALDRRYKGFEASQALVCSRRMEPGARETFNPAGAGGLLLATTAACAGIGALLGWAAGSAALGALGGVVVGIPAAIFVVYRSYRGSLS